MPLWWTEGIFEEQLKKAQMNSNLDEEQLTLKVSCSEICHPCQFWLQLSKPLKITEACGKKKKRENNVETENSLIQTHSEGSDNKASYSCCLLLLKQAWGTAETHTTNQSAPWDSACPFFWEADTSTAVEAVSLSAHITSAAPREPQRVAAPDLTENTPAFYSS